MAKLALPLTETTKTISIKDAINIPDGWERIATLAKVAGNEVIKMEKVIVKSRTENVLQVERGFESNPLQRETNDLLCLNVTAEVIRDLQNAVAEIDVNNKESLSNKKAKIVWNHTSNLFYPTVKAVWDWVTGLLSKKADLIDGKVPASQLPEVSQIDESNLVHKSWDEVIGGVKIFENWLIFRNSETDLQIKDLTLSKHDPKETQTISQYAKATNWTPWGIHFVDYVSGTPNWLTNWGKELRGYLHIGNATRTFDRFQVRGYEWFDGTEASLSNARKYIKLDAPKILLWDEDILWERKTWTPTNWAANITKHHCRYKKIGKTCHFLAEVYVNNVSGNTPWFTLPILRANYWTEFVVAWYCVRRWENPATQSRGAISFSWRDRVFTLWSTDVWAFTQPGEYIIRASWTYETE